MLSCIPQRELVLLARVRPFGAARVTLALSDIPDGCRLEMSEVAVRGPMKFLPDQLQAVGVVPRNRECAWRLAGLAEHRTPDDESVSG